MTNGVHLITYPDSLGSNIRELHDLLRRRFKAALKGVHLLPFYPSSADRGFAPMSYRTVDEAFGNWDDVENLGRDFELTVDFMINHVSARSSWFLDWLEKGSRSTWDELFLPVDRIYPKGLPPEDRRRIYTRKPRDPWISVGFGDGSSRDVWCSFGEEQIDVNVFSSVGRRWLKEELNFLCERPGVKTLRLDAVGYVTKKPGTAFFFEQPEITELLTYCRNLAAAKGVELLPEVHEHHRYQQMIAGWGYRTYDFALPMLLLYAFHEGRGEETGDWLKRCPHNQVTTLDTHDGIGVVDVADLLPQDKIDRTIEHLYEKGSNVKRRYSSAAYGNLDVYQINCTYYSALGEDDDAYLAARAVQMFAPGIPQVYYVGLLAGANDLILVEKSKQGRDINRHGYTAAETEKEIERPVVKRLLALMEFRSRHPSFDSDRPDIDISPDGRILKLHRKSENAFSELIVDFVSRKAWIKARDGETLESFSP